jgi:hypothetical protein
MDDCCKSKKTAKQTGLKMPLNVLVRAELAARDQRRQEQSVPVQRELKPGAKPRLGLLMSPAKPKEKDAFEKTSAWLQFGAEQRRYPHLFVFP